MTTAIDHNIAQPQAWTAPFNHAAVVAPSDTADLTNVTRAIRANVAGTIKIDTYGGEVGVTLNFAAGETRAIRATRIYATGTSATSIEALW